MTALRAIKSLGPIDVKSVRRDSLLRWMVLSPLMIGLAVRWFIPLLSKQIARQFSFEIAPYYILLMSILVSVVAIMYGMIVGFLLLDQRDDQTLVALQVTPLSLGGYFIYRISMPVLLSILGILVIVPLANLVPFGVLPLLMVALGSAPMAPVFALALASFAQNKVQGFALSKASGVLFLAPIVAYFIPSGWQIVLGLLPTYWPAKLFWVLQSGEPGAWIYLAAGLLYQALLIWILLRRFNLVMHR